MASCSDSNHYSHKFTDNNSSTTVSRSYELSRPSTNDDHPVRLISLHFDRDNHHHWDSQSVYRTDITSQSTRNVPTVPSAGRDPAPFVTRDNREKRRLTSHDARHAREN
ncbi:hypothetical protein N7471_006336 [Penicillium samsonianum]|uniref:uncharacterized protein n=1 Tax=Penicillium samsonianum TaxID=1882272 RepID=UPI0025489843|nr:uncharacterized protein N7471_006336 [Penicillium samsonianum]KAJ6139850.1 hypothetical protein N7471_006336 [Penicillium samsonianum]